MSGFTSIFPIAATRDDGTLRVVPFLAGAYRVSIDGSKELRVAAPLAREIDRVARAGERFGAEHIVDILRSGMQNREVFAIAASTPDRHFVVTRDANWSPIDSSTVPNDPALLHYRSGGFYLARAGLDGVRDVLAGVVAASDEPIAGGRHKVFGRHDLAIIPQTSTIASHLPRAVGVAFAIGRARKLRRLSGQATAGMPPSAPSFVTN